MKRLKLEDLIIYEDDAYLAINKPPFLSTLEDRNDPQCALMLVREHHADAQVCHRIDKETSGALLFAKNNEAYKHVTLQFEYRTILKEYHALVDGNTKLDKEEVHLPLRTLGSGKVFVDKFRGKEASTTFSTIKNYRKHSLLQCEPHTGRTHQIRVHLAFSGLPIVGDTLYGGQDFYLSSIKPKYQQKADREEQPLIRRFALHAHALIFSDQNDRKIRIQADYPKDFRILINQLDRNL